MTLKVPQTGNTQDKGMTHAQRQKVNCEHCGGNLKSWKTAFQTNPGGTKLAPIIDARIQHSMKTGTAFHAKGSTKHLPQTN